MKWTYLSNDTQQFKGEFILLFPKSFKYQGYYQIIDIKRAWNWLFRTNECNIKRCHDLVLFVEICNESVSFPTFCPKVYKTKSRISMRQLFKTQRCLRFRNVKCAPWKKVWKFEFSHTFVLWLLRKIYQPPNYTGWLLSSDG